MKGDADRRNTLRRYPALGFLAAAAALALLLPSGLTIPSSGPSSLAEYAPVTGDGTGEGDLSQIDEAGSGGLGSGSGPVRDGAGQGPGGVGAPDQPRANLKRCVGDPPKQTEDPLSPPCVPFFEGDNGGGTWRGVSGDEIRIAVQLPAYSSASPASPLVIDYADPDATDPDAVGDQIGQVVRAYARSFGDRYQLYGRRLHVFGYRGASGVPVQAQVQDLIDRIDPFDIVPLSLTACASFAKEAADRGVLSLCYTGFDRRLQQRVAPLLLSYVPDVQDGARIAASYACRKLVGRPARYSGNPTDRERARSIGVAFRRDNPEWALQSELFRSELRACGAGDVPAQSMRGGSDQAGDAALNMAGLRDAGATTVAVFGGNSDGLFWTNAAAGQSWYPEWFVPGSFLATGPDRNFVPRNYNQVEWGNAFGITFDLRRGAPREQQWHRAFNEGCGYCGDPPTSHPDIPGLYDLLVVLSWGLQSAGPNLTPANVDRGLHAIPPRSSAGPYAPAAYFSPGNYSWIKDATEIWWDASAEEPGTGRPGCYRLANSGARFRAGEWRERDDEIRRPADPCQGPDR